MKPVNLCRSAADLVTDVGAGAEMRNPLGVVVFSDMMDVTGFGLLLTPVSYVVIRGLASRHASETPAAHVEDERPAAAAH